MVNKEKYLSNIVHDPLLSHIIFRFVLLWVHFMGTFWVHFPKLSHFPKVLKKSETIWAHYSPHYFDFISSPSTVSKFGPH